MNVLHVPARLTQQQARDALAVWHGWVTPNELRAAEAIGCYLEREAVPPHGVLPEPHELPEWAIRLAAYREALKRERAGEWDGESLVRSLRERLREPMRAPRPAPSPRAMPADYR